MSRIYEAMVCIAFGLSIGLTITSLKLIERTHVLTEDIRLLHQDEEEKAKTDLLRIEATHDYVSQVQDQVSYIYTHFHLQNPQAISPAKIGK